MPINYEFDSTSETVRITCTGNLTVGEIGEYFEEIFSDESLGTGFVELVLLGGVTDFLFSSSEASQIPALYRKVKAHRKILGTVLLCENEFQFGIARMVQALFEFELPDHQFWPTRGLEEAQSAIQNLQAQKG